ncbi:MAG: queuosine precursor transporter [Dehalococcoidia bacterium]|nr:queuosine precursor transporter [Dehalococcoidia bacterium]
MKSTNRLLVIATLSVSCLITANIIAVKLISFGPMVLPAAVIVFPISYLFGDIITEVYGFHWTRRIIWLGFACNLIFVFFSWLAGVLPVATAWEGQDAYNSILGYTPRILLASFAGYLVGEFTNSYIMARLKITTRGRWLWLRTISSTIVGEGLDTTLFIVIAFIATPAFTPLMILYHWASKVLIEVLATPLVYRIVAYLKRKDNLDTYDHKTNFNPFSL